MDFEPAADPGRGFLRWGGSAGRGAGCTETFLARHIYGIGEHPAAALEEVPPIGLDAIDPAFFRAIRELAALGTCDKLSIFELPQFCL